MCCVLDWIYVTSYKVLLLHIIGCHILRSYGMPCGFLTSILIFYGIALDVIMIISRIMIRFWHIIAHHFFWYDWISCSFVIDACIVVLNVGTWHTIWIKFYISQHYHSTSFVIISKLYHIMWCCKRSMYFSILLYYALCYIGLYNISSDVIMAHRWSSSWVYCLRHVLMRWTPLFAWCTIPYCIFHDFIYAIHWLPSANILLHVAGHCKLSIRCISILDFIAQSKGCRSKVY